jgi:alpha-beta hydrolase superfamily lysophospholipase
MFTPRPPIPERFSRFPAALASQSRAAKLGPTQIPALLAHPDWTSPAPTVIWLHGRTVNKELDPGRYLRWIRAGLAACAIDLPGHGERFEAALQDPAASLDVIAQVLPEIDAVIESVADPAYGGAFDLERLAIGGMSLGGMATLRRLCDEHPFRCATLEATTGWLEGLYFPEKAGLAQTERWLVDHAPGRVAELDPAAHLSGFRPIPLLAVHSEADRVVPVEGMRIFLERLREHHRQRGADPSMIEFLTWPQTGAPQEHAGFGRFSNDAKNAQTEFLKRHLIPA